MLVTDTYHQFRPPMDFNRGFDIYHWIRGQEKDHYRPILPASDEEIRERYLLHGEALKARQHLANTRAERRRGLVRPQGVPPRPSSWRRPASGNPLPGSGQLRPARALGPASEKYTSLYYPEGYNGPEPFTTIYGRDDYPTERQLRRMRALYAGEVTMVDRWLGRFLDRMDELDLFENTLLILLSDHGHALGEHGYTGKPHYALWPELTDIVFMIRHPEGKGAEETSDHYASTHDVAPTILGFLGTEPEQPMEARISPCYSKAGDLSSAPTSL